MVKSKISRRDFVKSLATLPVASVLIGTTEKAQAIYNMGAFWKGSTNFGSVDVGDIGHSLRFRSSSGAFLSRTPGAVGNRQKWTVSLWVKRGKLGTGQQLFGCNEPGNQGYTFIHFNPNDQIYIASGTTVPNNPHLATSSAVFRDPHAWLHIVSTLDTTQADPNLRWRVWVNGKELTMNRTATVSQNSMEVTLNSTNTLYIGQQGISSTYFDGNLSRIAFVDGQALTPTSFGYLNANINEWVSKTQAQVKTAVDAGGTNSFLLDFDNGTSLATLGSDKSAKGNHWACNNISLTAGTSYDWMLDVPGNSFCNLNPLLKPSNSTFSDANLSVTRANTGVSAFYYPCLGTFAIPRSGKWYYELAYSFDGNHGLWIGLSGQNISPSATMPSAYRCYWISNNGGYYGYVTSESAASNNNGNKPGSGTIGIAVDMDNGKFWASIDGTWQGGGSPSSGTSPGFADIGGLDWYPYHGGFVYTGSYSNTWINFGQAPLHASATYSASARGYFQYAPPTGFKALCQANLPEPSIRNPVKHFEAVTYAGNGASPRQIITGLSFKPDLVWVKSRTSTQNQNIYDSVRGVGAGKLLIANLTDAEGGAVGRQDSVYGYVSAFNSDGITATAGSFDNSALNQSGQNFISWLWKANDSGSSNNSGSIASTVSANTSAGFSIVSWTQDGTSPDTVGHGLGKKPAFIIMKNRDISQDCNVWHQGLVSDQHYLILNSTAGQNNTATIFSGTWNNTVFGVQGIYATDVGKKMIAYCFNEIAGYSRFGSYTGNGSVDGPFLWCGFKPKFLMVKRIDAAASWFVSDTLRNPYNLATYGLYPNLSDIENSGDDLDLLSNGIKIRDTSTQFNASNGSYIYIAFAETPGKYSLAR